MKLQKKCGLMVLLLLTVLFQTPESYSTNAYVTVTYYNQSSNHSTTEVCECGIYGLASPVANAGGTVGIPKSFNYQACDPHTEFTYSDTPWIALIERGNCTFSEKIQTANRRGAEAAVIYNVPESGNETLQMANFGAGDIVSIMIGNLKGTKILQSIQRGIQVTMVIEVGKKHGPWMNHYSIFFVSVSFFIVTAATVGYFIFYSARRLRNARAQNRKQRQLKADAKRAIGKLQLRALKHGDKETGPDGDSCAVCIEIFRPNDIVRILTCNHLFHKTCIDPWLLEHRTCPMCKCDILKALGVEADVEAGTVSFQTAGSNPNINGSPESYSPREEDSHSETASSGYASVQGADEPPLEERAQSQNVSWYPHDVRRKRGRLPARWVDPPVENFWENLDRVSQDGQAWMGCDLHPWKELLNDAIADPFEYVDELEGKRAQETSLRPRGQDLGLFYLPPHPLSPSNVVTATQAGKGFELPLKLPPLKTGIW